jgi:hypothetical protein
LCTVILQRDIQKRDGSEHTVDDTEIRWADGEIIAEADDNQALLNGLTQIYWRVDTHIDGSRGILRVFQSGGMLDLEEEFSFWVKIGIWFLSRYFVHYNVAHGGVKRRPVIRGSST